jgi:hypothetical protein
VGLIADKNISGKYYALLEIQSPLKRLSSGMGLAENGINP